MSFWRRPWLSRKPKPVTPPISKGQRLVALARHAIAHEPQIHYTMSAKRDDWLHVAKFNSGVLPLPLYTDCSGFATLLYYLAGLPDPNGFSYRSLGYTGTLLRHMKHISKHEAKPGDLVVWGPPPGHHVALVLEGGSDPLLASHGQEKGPFAIRFSVESRYQPSPATWLTTLG